MPNRQITVKVTCQPSGRSAAPPFEFPLIPSAIRRWSYSVPSFLRIRTEKKATMVAAILTSKGQVTIPAAVRTALGVDVGDRLEFIETEPGRFEVIAATLPITALKWLIAKPAKPVSTSDMKAAIHKRAKRSFRPWLTGESLRRSS